MSEARRGLKDKSDFLACTNEFRERLRNGETIDDIKVEALSVVREAIRRVLGMYPFDVQIEASLAMSESVIAEMKTGEGKTLVQMLVAYLNLLEATMDEDSSKWKGVHIMTANDALAKRDADQNRGVFELLGFTCGFVPSRKSTAGYTNEQLFEYKKNKKNAYSCDVTYASATTIAFDYLDDNCIYRERDLNINKEFGYAIIDEADDLLIDKAINPLLINGEIDGIDPEYSKNLQSMNAVNLYAYKWATEFLYENDLSYKVYDQYEKDKDHVIESSINDKKYVDKIGVNYVYYLDTREVFLSEETTNYLYSGLDNLE